MMNIAYDDGSGVVFKELDNIDEIEVYDYSSVFIVENGTEEELKAVCQWASEILENSVLVVDSVIDVRLINPLTFIEEIREDWDEYLTDGEEFHVQSISDIVDLYWLKKLYDSFDIDFWLC